MIETEINQLNGICFYQDELRSKIEPVIYQPNSEHCWIDWNVVDSLTTNKMYQFGVFYVDGSSSIQDFVVPDIEYFTIIVILGASSPETLRSIEQQCGSNSRIGIVEIKHMDDVHLFTRSMLDIIGSRGLTGVDFADVQSFFPVGITHLQYAKATGSPSAAAFTVSNKLIASGGIPCRNSLISVHIGTNGRLLDIHTVQEKLQTAEISDGLIIGGYVYPNLDTHGPGTVHVGLISFL